MVDVETRRRARLVGARRWIVARGGLAAAAASAIVLGAPVFALGQNYCVPHPTAEGCNLPRTGPHITAASITHGRLRLKLTFHKAGRFVAHLRRNPPPEPYDRDWGPRPTLGRSIPIGSQQAGPGTIAIALGTLRQGRYGVVVIPANPARAEPGQPLDPSNVPSWVYFTERAGHAVEVRILQP